MRSNAKRSCGFAQTNAQTTTRPSQMNPVMRLLISSAVILGLWQMVVYLRDAKFHSASACRSLHQANRTLRCVAQALG